MEAGIRSVEMFHITADVTSFAAPPKPGPTYPQRVRRIRKAAKPPTAAQPLCSGFVFDSFKVCFETTLFCAYARSILCTFFE